MSTPPSQGAAATASTNSATDPSATTARSFTAFLLPPPMTFYVQLGNGLQLELMPSPERLLSSFLNAGATGVPLVPIVFTAPFGAGGDSDAMMRAMHELFMRSQSEQHGPPPTSKSFLANLPLKTWNTATCATEKYTDCAICLSEYETDDQVMSLPCGHAFHKDCGMPWLVEHNVCPTCRYQMPTQEADKPAADAAVSSDTTTATDAPAATASESEQQTEETREPEEEPMFERMLRTLLGVRRERSPTFSEPQPARAVRQRMDDATEVVTLPGAVSTDDESAATDSDAAALDSLLEEEASRFVEEENGKRLAATRATDDDHDAAIFDAVDVDELLRDSRTTPL